MNTLRSIPLALVTVLAASLPVSDAGPRSKPAAAPEVIARPPAQPKGTPPFLDTRDAGRDLELAKQPLRLPFRTAVFRTQDATVTDDYLVALSPTAGGGLKGDFRFQSGQPADRFWLELTPLALAEARGLLTVQQGNEHLFENGQRLDAGRGYLRALRFENTTFPFWPSRRLVAESRTGKINAITVGQEERLPGLVRQGAGEFTLAVRKRQVTVTAERFVVDNENGARDGELLLVHSVPGLGDVDLVVSIKTYSHETQLRSLD